MRPWALAIWFVPFLLDRFDAFVRKHAVTLSPWQPLRPHFRFVLWGTFGNSYGFTRDPPVRFIDIRTPFIDWASFDFADHYGFGRRHYMWRSDRGWREWHEEIET